MKLTIIEIIYGDAMVLAKLCILYNIIFFIFYRQPYFGYVKRSMNRAPSDKDFWWSRHQASCGGTFTKISEPEKKQVNRKNEKTTQLDSKKEKKVKLKTENSSTDNSSSPNVLDWIFNKPANAESIREMRLRWLDKKSISSELKDSKPLINYPVNSSNEKPPIVLDLLDYDLEDEIIEL